MRESRPDPIRDTGLHVFVPAMLGAGMIVSGILVVADWVHKLLPDGRVRRRQEVAAGARGVVEGVMRAAGYEVEGPDLRRREWRPRWVYALGSLVLAAVGSVALVGGLVAFNDDAGLLHGNPWMVGLGVGTAAVLGLLALQLGFFGVVHRRSFRAAHLLVETTWFGRLRPPPQDPAAFVSSMRLVRREGGV